MKVLDTLPEAGTEFEWDIDEITSRMSGDLPWYFTDPDYNPDDEYDDGLMYVSREEKNVSVEAIRTAWENCMRRKRDDAHYADLLEEIRVNGFTKPVNAFTADGELRLCDGHHRVAAAVQLGLTAIPVKVSKKVRIDNDSGSWKWDGYSTVDNEPDF